MTKIPQPKRRAKGKISNPTQDTPSPKTKQSERFRIILVQPKYEQNLGAVARIMKNFGFSELYLVAPRCDPLGFDSIKFSKHARELLEGAKICKDFAAARRGCKFAVGTTGVIFRHWNETFRSPILLRELEKKLASEKEGKVALVFGNEEVGLSERDISACDFLVTIPASKTYPILNLSHAVAITLYELSGLNTPNFAQAGEREKEKLMEAFGLLVDRYGKLMRNPRKVKIAFRRMVGKAMLSDKECVSILGVVRRAVRELDGKGEAPKYA